MQTGDIGSSVRNPEIMEHVLAMLHHVNRAPRINPAMAMAVIAWKMAALGPEDSLLVAMAEVLLWRLRSTTRQAGWCIERS